jgi:hypothetical protein
MRRQPSGIKTFSNGEKLRICHQHTYPKRMAKEISVSRKKIIREGI